VIGKRLSAMEMACGGCDVGELATAFAAANADPAVSRIVLHIDSPGGTVTGVPELAAMIYDTKQKPVEAVTDTLIGSAAYWIAAAADSITATPSAQVGSIGAVLQVRETIDPTSADGRTRLRVFRSGEDKFAGADAPLTAAQATAYQGTVDTIGDLFRSSVTEARPRIAGESMTGRVYLGNEAMARGLVDNVVAALPDYFAAPSAQAAAPNAAFNCPPLTSQLAPAPAAQTFNITLPAMTFGAPTVNVDARMEKDSIRVEQSQTTSGAKKIERDAKGTVTGVIDAPA
jgi:ClpP class serine protease